MCVCAPACPHAAPTLGHEACATERFQIRGHDAGREAVMSHVISAIRHLTYIQLFYGEYNPEGRYDGSRVTQMEIRIRYDNLAKLPRRRFAPPCRPLCGFDLHRWHVTCLL